MGFNDLKKPSTRINGADTVYVSGPASTFGEILVSQFDPVAQGDFVYNVNDQVFTNTQFAGGSLTTSDGMAVLSSGTDPSGSAVVQLRRGLKYKSGQGSLMRGTAVFDTPDAGNAQFLGLGNAECGYFIGYFGTNFGILHSEDGSREIRALSVTTGATTGNVTVTLDGDSVVVPVTGGSDTTQTAYQLSLGDYTQVGNGGWLAGVVGNTVYFLSARSGPASGAYSVAGSSIVGTFSQVKAGEAQTNTFIPSGSFNIDKLDGTGPSEMVLDPFRGNVYQIGFQYLGFGNAKFYVEDPNSGSPFLFHEIKNVNSRTTPVLKNPNVSVLATSANIGGTTSVDLKTASLAAFTEGKIRKLDPKFSHSVSFSGVNESAYVPLLLLKANRVYQGISSFGEFDLLKIGASNEVNNKTLSIALFLDVAVTGDVNFQHVDEENSIVSYAQVNPTTQTLVNPTSPIFETLVGSASSKTLDISDLDFVFGAGQTIVVAIKTTAALTGQVVINWFEQQ